VNDDYPIEWDYPDWDDLPDAPDTAPEAAPDPLDRLPNDPSPEEIARLCEQIRAGRGPSGWRKEKSKNQRDSNYGMSGEQSGPRIYKHPTFERHKE
jgi:hypothetical protein